MTRHTIIATVTVEVELVVEAEDPAAAEAKFRENLNLNVSLGSICPTEFDVWNDTITDIEDLTVEEEH
jgi:hypothetical protein